MATLLKEDHTMLLTGSDGKPRRSGFHCRELDKAAYKTLRRLMEVTGATTEEALQALIQFGAHAWQLPQDKARLVEMIQGWKARRPKEEMMIHPIMP
jgi:hypothetical protein